MIFLGLIWGRINSKLSKNFPKWCISFPISEFYKLVKFLWNSEQRYQSYRCMKICLKMWMKTCFHSHFYANFHEFLWWAIKATIMLQLYTAYFLRICFNPFNIAELSVLLDYIKFAQFWWPKPKFNSPWPQLQKGRKNPADGKGLGQAL